MTGTPFHHSYVVNASDTVSFKTLFISVIISWLIIWLHKEPLIINQINQYPPPNFFFHWAAWPTVKLTRCVLIRTRIRVKAPNYPCTTYATGERYNYIAMSDAINYIILPYQ